ncbi:MAG: sugar phosphate isomerase/epimerase family protein [Bacillota bacterium]
MVKFGCCVAIGSFVPQMDEQEKDVLEGFKNAFSILEENGFDFAELTIGSIANLTSAEFKEVVKLVQESSIPVPVFNCFIPGDIPVTGPNVSYNKIEKYLHQVMKRVKRIGGKCIVFGSGSARKVPEGFPGEKAQKQIEKFLDICNKKGREFEIKVAIEPLNKKETNIINTVEEALNLAKKVDLPQIKVLADSYHMYEENESFDILQDAEKKLIHVHIADKDRKFPGKITDEGVDFKEFFKMLKSINYNEKISLECNFADLEEESKQSFAYITKVWQEA